MNNDMDAKFNHIEKQNNYASDCISRQESCGNRILINEETIRNFISEDSNCEKVRKSVSEFIKNPEIVESYVSICDGFVEKGYCLRDAIEKTDEVFIALKNKNIYE